MALDDRSPPRRTRPYREVALGHIRGLLTSDDAMQRAVLREQLDLTLLSDTHLARLLATLRQRAARSTGRLSLIQQIAAHARNEAGIERARSALRAAATDRVLTSGDRWRAEEALRLALLRLRGGDRR